MKILIVDDEVNDIERVKNILTHVLPVGSFKFLEGQTSLRDAKVMLDFCRKKGESYDLVITDMDLTSKGGEGVELIRYIREQDMKTHIIGHSSSQELSEKKMIEAGANAYASKFNREGLESAIREAAKNLFPSAAVSADTITQDPIPLIQKS